jgi:poly-gamma-glutamate synthesis protein (capsule biosynthesis protein)
MKSKKALFKSPGFAILCICIPALFFSCAGEKTKPEVINPMPTPCEISFCAAGDVMLDRGVKNRIDDDGRDYIFKKTAGFIRLKDISFCNLECPVSTRGKRKSGGYAFRADPKNLNIIKKCGFKVVSVANNHMMDYGGDSLSDTFKYLQDNDITYAGAGQNREEARSYVIKEANGVKVAFIAELNMPTVVEEVPEDATLPQPSQKRSLADLTAEIQKAKLAADIVVVSFHWGVEYTHNPQAYQKRLARACIDAGADMVLGHHPHVMQGIEIYKGKIILYSMGNLVFDQFRVMTSRTFIFACDFLKNGTVKNAFITPVEIVKNRPIFARGAVAEEIRALMMKISKGFGTKFEEKDGRLYLQGL